MGDYFTKEHTQLWLDSVKEKSYYELKKFKKIKNKIDKKNIFQSFQSKRLFISE